MGDVTDLGDGSSSPEQTSTLFSTCSAALADKNVTRRCRQFRSVHRDSDLHLPRFTFESYSKIKNKNLNRTKNGFFKTNQASIDLKLSIICQNIFSYSAPACFSDILTVYTPSRQLRSSADTRVLRDSIPCWNKNLWPITLSLVVCPRAMEFSFF